MRCAAAALLLWLLLPACGDSVRRHEGLGVVREVRPEWGQVVIAHEDIEGLMPAMTMNFDVPDAALLESLEKGQRIRFALEADADGYRVVGVEVLGAADVKEGRGLAGLLPARDPAPDFALTNQAGAPVSLTSLRGTVLLIDFVYTRCPGPCPVQTARHVALQRSLAPELRERTRFVSISLDPANDTPAALREYAEARGADLAHWDFLTGPPEELARLVKRFGVGTLRQPDGQIEHLTVTFLVDAEGRIAERYLGLDHSAETLRRDLERLAAGSAADSAPRAAG